MTSEDHLEWARSIARKVRAKYGFLPGSQEQLDLEQTAYVALCELVQRYRPAEVTTNEVEAFRGWGYVTIKNKCQREADRLTNGGTYHTRRQASVKGRHKPVAVVSVHRLSPDLPEFVYDFTEPEFDTMPTPSPPVEVPIQPAASIASFEAQRIEL
jgi:hypothetical protein